MFCKTLQEFKDSKLSNNLEFCRKLFYKALPEEYEPNRTGASINILTNGTYDKKLFDQIYYYNIHDAGDKDLKKLIEKNPMYKK